MYEETKPNALSKNSHQINGAILEEFYRIFGTEDEVKSHLIEKVKECSESKEFLDGTSDIAQIQERKSAIYSYAKLIGYKFVFRAIPDSHTEA